MLIWNVSGMLQSLQTNPPYPAADCFVEFLFYWMKPECFGDLLKMLVLPARKEEGALGVTSSGHRPG